MAEMHLHSPRDPVPVVLGPSHPCPYLDRRVARFAYATSLPAGEAGSRSCSTPASAAPASSSTAPPATPAANARRSGSPSRTSSPTARNAARSPRTTTSRSPSAPPVSTGERKALRSLPRAATRRPDEQQARRKLEDGLYKSPVETVELAARLDERLVAVGIIDVESRPPVPRLLGLGSGARQPLARHRVRAVVDRARAAARLSLGAPRILGPPVAAHGVQGALPPARAAAARTAAGAAWSDPSPLGDQLAVGDLRKRRRRRSLRGVGREQAVGPPLVRGRVVAAEQSLLFRARLEALLALLHRRIGAVLAARHVAAPEPEVPDEELANAARSRARRPPKCSRASSTHRA